MVEEMHGMTRVKSSLELLSHTATLKSEIEAKEEMERRLEGAGRVSPASPVTGGDHHRGVVAAACVSSPSPRSTQDRALVVSPKDTNRNYGSANTDPGYSIEGYACGDDMMKYEETNPADLSPIPSQPAENLSEYLSQGRGGGGAPTSAALLPKSISASASTSFLLKFNPLNKATGALSRREAGTTFFLPGHQDFEGGTLGGSRGGGGLGLGLDLSRAYPSASFGSSCDLSSIPRESSNVVQLEIENAELRKLLIAKDDKIASLEESVASLEKQIADLRQLPTGKISQIPVEYVRSLQLVRSASFESSAYCLTSGSFRCQIIS
jgi:hypothetical protein